MADGIAATSGWNTGVKLLMALTVLLLAACGGGRGDPSMAGASPAATMLQAKLDGSAGLVAQPASLVNTTTAGNQVVRAVGALADGGYAVAWLSQDSGPASIYLQRYDAFGAKAGGEVAIPFVPDPQSQLSLAVLADGGLLVAYSATRTPSPSDPLSVTNGIYTRRFDAAGAPLGGETTVALVAQNLSGAQTLYSVEAPTAFASADGGYFVGWAFAQQDYTGRVRTPAVQRYDSSGQPVGTQRTFNGGGDQNLSFGLLPRPTGSYVFESAHRFMGELYVTFDLVGDGGITGRIGALYDATLGLPAAATTLLPLSDGRFALWSRNAQGPYLRLFDSSGNALGSTIPVTALPDTVSALADGGFVVFTRTGASLAQLSAQRFDGTGAAVGAPLLLDTGGSLPVTALLGDGSLALAWTAIGAGGDTDVYTQLLDVAVAQDKQALKHSCQLQAKGLMGAARKQFMAACIAA